MTLPLLLALKRCLPAERDAVVAVLKTAARRTLELEAEGVLAPERVLERASSRPCSSVVRRHRGVEDTNARARAARRSAPPTRSRPSPTAPCKEALARGRWLRRSSARADPLGASLPRPAVPRRDP